MFKGENAKGRIQRPTKAYERRFSNYKIVNKAGATSRFKSICLSFNDFVSAYPDLIARERRVFASIPLRMERPIEMKTETDGGFHPETTYL
jgi:hypothetical protein